MDSVANNILDAIKNIDWNPIFITGYFIVENALKNKKYSIKKDENLFKDVNGIYFPPKLKKRYKNINFKELIQKEFGDSLYTFAQTLIENFSSMNLINFYNNINELKINSRDKFEFHDLKGELYLLIFGNKFSGCYSPTLNKIYAYEEFKLVLFHELFHMASTFYDKKNDIVYSGFSQRCIKKYVGVGIDEGYTEHLTEVYFANKPLRATITYKYLKNVANLIDLGIGKDEMQKFYLNSNLNGLINEMSKYVGVENALKFIESTDYIYNNLEKSIKNKKKLEKHLKFVNIITLSIYTNYLVKVYMEKNIPLSKLNLGITGLFNNTLRVECKNTKYDCIPTKQTIDAIISDTLKKYENIHKKNI